MHSLQEIIGKEPFLNQVLDNGGKPHLMKEKNGFGKYSSETEGTAVVKDWLLPKSLLVAKSVEVFQLILQVRMENGTLSNVQDHSRELKYKLQ
jgi:hypothetical protein